MRLYFRLLLASMRGRMQYKVDFIVSTLLYGVLAGIDFLTVAAVLYRYGAVGGWSILEVALLSGIVSAANGLLRNFASELHVFQRYVMTGEFDSLLIRPWPTLASLLARNLDMSRLGALAQGILLIALGAAGLDLPLWARVYVFVVPLAGFCLLVSLNVMVAAAGFWVIQINELMEMTVQTPMAANQYPLEIYPEVLRWIFLTLLPVGAVGYVPVRYLLGKGGGPWALAVPFIASAVAVLVALQVWRFGERRYQSTGT